MSTYLYAAYGSNLHPVRLRKRVQSARLLGVGRLEGYELRFNKIGWKDSSAKCNIVPMSSSVFLAVFELLETERAILDDVEGVGSGYSSADIEIEGFGVCSTYIGDPGAIDESRRPMDWYKEMVLLGCAAHGFPAYYVEAIRAVSATTDPHAARAREQWEIVQELREAGRREFAPEGR